MASDRQIAANRANARKSTGPKTQAGRRKSSQNSRRHGLLAESIVLDGESPRRFRNLLASLQATLQPANPVEHDLVENMAVARWRQLRFWSMEKSGLSHELRSQQSQPDAPAEKENSSVRLAVAFRSLCDSGRSLDLIHRYELRYDRQYARALAQLVQLREKTNSAERTQFSPPLIPEEQP